MKRIIFPAAVLAAGLLVSQAIFFFFVYRSNLALHAKLMAMDAAGYLIVPNPIVMAELTRFLPAFNGALFFTLTVGAGLCIAAMAGAWLYSRVFNGSRKFAFLLIVLWLAALIAVNAGGFSLLATIPLLLIPPFVFIAHVYHMPSEIRPQGRLVLFLQVACVVVIALLWLPKADRDIFIEIRDNLLLSTGVGAAVNDFYYRYTLYPAKLFKTTGQKLIVPACTNDIRDEALKVRVDTVLAAHDFLPVHGSGPCDLYVTLDNDRLAFSLNGKGILKKNVSDFFQAPRSVLLDFSQRTDNQHFFRLITFYSLFAAFPLALFILFHGLICVLLFMVPQIFLRHGLATLVCLFIGLGAAVPLYLGANAPMTTPDEIQAGLLSGDRQLQRRALMALSASDMDPLAFKIDSRILESQHVPIRYWLAAALGNGRGPGAADLLWPMIADPHPNVVCSAYSSIGRVGGRGDAEKIIQGISASDHWYVQWYAYRALRQLGWTQKPSGTNPGRL